MSNKIIDQSPYRGLSRRSRILKFESFSRGLSSFLNSHLAFSFSQTQRRKYVRTDNFRPTPFCLPGGEMTVSCSKLGSARWNIVYGRGPSVKPIEADIRSRERRRAREPVRMPGDPPVVSLDDARTRGRDAHRTSSPRLHAPRAFPQRVYARGKADGIGYQVPPARRAIPRRHAR